MLAYLKIEPYCWRFAETVLPQMFPLNQISLYLPTWWLLWWWFHEYSNYDTQMISHINLRLWFIDHPALKKVLKIYRGLWFIDPLTRWYPWATHRNNGTSRLILVSDRSSYSDRSMQGHLEHTLGTQRTMHKPPHCWLRQELSTFTTLRQYWPARPIFEFSLSPRQFFFKHSPKAVHTIAVTTAINMSRCARSAQGMLSSWLKDIYFCYYSW